MASAHSTRTPGGPGEPGPEADSTATDRAPLAAAVAFSSTLALAAFMLIAPLIHAVVPVTDLPDPFIDHHQDAETLLFALSFLVLLPLGAWAGPRVADRLAAGPNRDAGLALAGASTALLAVAVLGARASTVVVLSLGAAVWFAIVALALRRAARAWPLAARLAPHAAAVWGLAAVLVAGCALAFSAVASISLPILLLGGLAAAVAVAARDRIRMPEMRRPLGPLADAVLIVLLLLAIPNIAIFAAGGGAGQALQTGFIQFHQNLFLGPTNQVLAGDALLVDTLSQYGVGSIYFLAGIFNLIPIGNETLGLVEGVLSALMFIGAWTVMRIAGVSRLLAATAMFVAVVALVYGLQYPLGGLLQHGAFRFGLPIGVVVGAVAEARWPSHQRSARALQVGTVALASIWALEGFAYSVFTVMVVAALTVWLAPVGERRGEAVRWIVQLLAACVAAHVLLAAVTLAARGELPEWGWYLNTLREFLFGRIGDLTYDFSRWSPGVALGALYLVSASALLIMLRRRPELALKERAMVVAIAGMTAFGIALLSYVVNRGSDHIIAYVALPAVTLGALWLSLLERPVLALPPRAKRGALGFVLAIAVLLVAVAASSFDVRFHQSVLAYARPGGASLSAAFDRAWNPPQLRPGATDGVELLEQYMPGESRSSVIVSADLGIEILLRAERGSAVPLGDPWEDSFVPEQHISRLTEYVDGLEAGDLLLVDAPAQEVFDSYRADPSQDPLMPSTEGAEGAAASGLASLQKWTLKEIGMRFGLQTVATTPSGVEVVRLVPRKPTA